MNGNTREGLGLVGAQFLILAGEKSFRTDGGEAAILPRLVCGLRPARRGAVDERALTEAGNRVVH